MMSVMPVCRKALHHGEDFVHELGIQRGRDLIAEQCTRLHGKRARDRNTLLLPSRKLLGECCEFFRESHAREHFFRRRARLTSVTP